MTRFIVERLLPLALVIVIVPTLTFLLLRLAPGDPAQIILYENGVPASETAIESLREELGLTGTLSSQYVEWVRQMVTGQWGTSFVSKQPVLEELMQRLPATLELAVAGLVVMLLFTFTLGITTAIWSNGWMDRIGRFFALFGSSIPSFWLGFLLLYYFSVNYQWFPSMGRGTWKHLMLPALTLGFGLGTVYARVLRSNVLEMMQQNFVKAQKARGFSTRKVVLSSVLKHAFLPIVTMVGTSFAFMLGGSIIVETIFSWPGLGRYIVESIKYRDYPVIQGYVLFVTVLFVTIHLIVDFIYVMLDPRLRVR
ncbi:nickel ABC transporter permease [Alkalihalobacillus sp. LMS39]|uniref:nickel ABC transporter permease n=1 Tax=Alkalihalobacillus sp. LMS39 TaxID=2924032 RepID=UPI001FB38335|nr:nickel ABC transporter permease [Alkalihalobacillus sp. LMS39]UOE94839.1 ABC transporter permease [Alkalihalobacillus sp. LMS39]